MSETPEVISPRGIPPIRPDWLIDVAWRLSNWELDRLRSVGAEHATLEDQIDHEPWRFDSERLSPAWATQVEHEADLFLPTDTTTAKLRAGFALTPWWDETRGRCVHARVEIGPRGPVTFDPENWATILPLPGVGESRPKVETLIAADWVGLGGEAVPWPEVDPQTIAGDALDLVDVALLLDDEKQIPELLLPAFGLVPKRGLLGRGRLVPADLPDHVARITADGPLEANWTGEAALADAATRGPWTVAAVEATGGAVTLRGETGVLTLTGPGARLVVHRPQTVLDAG